jgi:hypothetical protein
MARLAKYFLDSVLIFWFLTDRLTLARRAMSLANAYVLIFARTHGAADRIYGRISVFTFTMSMQGCFT